MLQDYEVKEDPVIFRVNLSTLIECLTIFDGISSTPGASTAVKLKYRQHGAPLQVLYVDLYFFFYISIKCLRLKTALNKSGNMLAIIQQLQSRSKNCPLQN